MTPPSDTAPESMTSSRSGSQRFSAVRMPVDEPIDDLEDAVQKLKQCSSTELHRARQHHRRALESLQNGGYTSLSDSTRARLVDHLRDNLEALNLALEPDDVPSSNGSPRSEGTKQTEDSEASFSTRVKKFIRRLWSSIGRNEA